MCFRPLHAMLEVVVPLCLVRIQMMTAREYDSCELRAFPEGKLRRK